MAVQLVFKRYPSPSSNRQLACWRRGRRTRRRIIVLSRSYIGTALLDDPTVDLLLVHKCVLIIHQCLIGMRSGRNQHVCFGIVLFAWKNVTIYQSVSFTLYTQPLLSRYCVNYKTYCILLCCLKKQGALITYIW